MKKVESASKRASLGEQKAQSIAEQLKLKFEDGNQSDSSDSQSSRQGTRLDDIFRFKYEITKDGKVVRRF